MDKDTILFFCKSENNNYFCRIDMGRRKLPEKEKWTECKMFESGKFKRSDEIEVSDTITLLQGGIEKPALVLRVGSSYFSVFIKELDRSVSYHKKTGLPRRLEEWSRSLEGTELVLKRMERIISAP